MDRWQVIIDACILLKHTTDNGGHWDYNLESDALKALLEIEKIIQWRAVVKKELPK